jgi:predicted nucleic acid-binding protein
VTAFVLDNSVTMRWCFDGGNNAYADNVLETLVATVGEARVPVLWRYEVSAVLARAQKIGVLTAERVTDFLGTLEALNIVMDPHGVDRILTDVHRLAVSYRLTSYDATYLELALRENISIATLDEELRAACRATQVTIL